MKRLLLFITILIVSLNTLYAQSKDQYTEVVFILDNVGAESVKEDHIIKGFNSTLAKLKKESGKVIITTVLLNKRYRRG